MSFIIIEEIKRIIQSYLTNPIIDDDFSKDIHLQHFSHIQISLVKFQIFLQTIIEMAQLFLGYQIEISQIQKLKDYYYSLLEYRFSLFIFPYAYKIITILKVKKLF